MKLVLILDSVFFFKSSINCLNTKDKIFAPMDDDLSCLFFFSCFSSLKSSVNCQNTKDKIFAPMDDDRPCLIFVFFLSSQRKNTV